MPINRKTFNLDLDDPSEIVEVIEAYVERAKEVAEDEMQDKIDELETKLDDLERENDDHLNRIKELEVDLL